MNRGTMRAPLDNEELELPEPVFPAVKQFESSTQVQSQGLYTFYLLYICTNIIRSNLLSLLRLFPLLRSQRSSMPRRAEKSTTVDASGMRRVREEWYSREGEKGRGHDGRLSSDATGP